MNTYQKIKVFLASSDELRDDRESFGNFVRRLDDLYEKRNKRIKLFEWEDSDAAYNNRRKQDEYNDEVRASDMFLALFYIKAGKYTIEEFKVATEEYHRTGYKPKPYVYLRELKEGDQESDELISFKHHLSEELGYYWCNYNSRDSLQLHFVMQLLLVENSRLDELKLEDGKVMLDGTTIARLENLKFAADNPDYQRMKLRLIELPSLIEKARLHIEKYPDDEDLQEELQRLLNERNRLQEEFDQQQNLLFETSKHVAQIQGRVITERMQRAIEAFDKGDVHKANAILSVTENDATRNYTSFLHSKASTDQIRQNVIGSIEELLLKTSTIMSDASIAIDERIRITISAYKQSDELAEGIGYEKESYVKLLSDYSLFLNKYGYYKDAEKICLHQISLAKEVYGEEHEEIANAFNNIAEIYRVLNNYSKALEFLFKALAIDEKILGKKHDNIAAIYNNIGGVYWDQGNYPLALLYFHKSLDVVLSLFGKDNLHTAITYNNIGTVYEAQHEYTMSLAYLQDALEIRKDLLGETHPDTTATYNNIGAVYWKQGNASKALEYFNLALSIDEKELGVKHPATATDYNNIGLVYKSIEDYSIALEYYLKAMAIREKVFGEDNINTAYSYNNIGVTYREMGDYNKSEEYLNKALVIFNNDLGPTHYYSQFVQQQLADMKVQRNARMMGETQQTSSH
ncbi:MAG: tetratricopeptide repeat protein [Bacteroidales bacterium]|nr:tetratricopeptide repeat protein [Bacteroidales bacterium]